MGADANRMRLILAEEATYATAPAGAWTEIIGTSEDLRSNATIRDSEMMRSDAQLADSRRVNVAAGGPFSFELLSGAYDDLWLAAIRSDAGSWPAKSTLISAETGVSFVSRATAGGDAQINDSGSGLAGAVVNSWLYVSGATSDSANGFHKVKTKAAGQIEVYGDLPNEGTGASVTITVGGTITNGTTLKTYAIEKQFLDESLFSLFLGQGIGGASLNIGPEDNVTGSFDFMGKREPAVSPSATASASIVAQPGNPVFNGTTDAPTLEEGTRRVTMTGATFSIENGLRRRLVVGGLGADSIGQGTLRITGSASMYFADQIIKDKYLADTWTRFGFGLMGTDGKGYVFDFPRVRIGKSDQVGEGRDTDVIDDVEWTAVMEPTELITIRIARWE